MSTGRIRIKYNVQISDRLLLSQLATNQMTVTDISEKL